MTPRVSRVPNLELASIDRSSGREHNGGMSALETLIHELQGQPEMVARKALDYARSLPEWKGNAGVPAQPGLGYFNSHWREFYGAFEGEPWEEPPELPAERREPW